MSVALSPDLSENLRKDRREALALVPVSRETEERLALFVALLGRWRSSINLVSNGTFAHVWTRHVADSLQLLDLAPDARGWVDLGTGAGFPGIVLAIALRGVDGAVVHCVESDRRKCSFLREAARVTGAPAEIHATRIELIARASFGPVDAVTARALAPLPQLLQFAKLWLEHDAIGLFPRGRTADGQLEGAALPAGYEFNKFPSRTDSESSIIRVRRAESPKQ